jgi:cytochrome c551/c552
MTLKKIATPAALFVAASLWIACSSKEDKEQYDKYYGSGRADRQATSPDRSGIDPDTINSLSVTDNAADQVGGASSQRFDSNVEVAGKTQADVSQKAPAATPAATTKPAATTGAATTGAKPEAPKAQKEVPADIAALLNKHTCTACHRPYDRLVGPAYSEVAKRKYSADRIVQLVHKPEPANWPDYPPMMALPNVPKEDIVKIAGWINSL